ncbi:MAG: glycosyltransferase family 39 protein [Chloroflexota bacterium]
MKSQQAAPQKSGISLAWADHPYLQLGLIIVLGVGLRLFQLGTQSLWFDEAISYLAASLSPFEILQNPVQSSHPPLYYLALHSWRGIMPDTDAGVRALSVFWGTLLIPTSYLLAKTLFPQRNTAIVAAILVAVAPFQIIYSQELRMYTQVMVLVTCGVYAYWQGRQGRHGVWWAICFISFLCAAYTHSFSVLAISALGLHALVYRRQNISALWLIVTLGIITFLAMLPWFYGLLTESEKSLGSLRPLAQTMSRSVVKPLASLNFLLFGQSSGLWLGAIALFLTISLTIMSIIEVNKQWRIGQPEAISLLLLIIVCAFGIPITLYLIRPFFLPDRAFSIASPFLLC